MPENFIYSPISLYCSAGKTVATVLLPVEQILHDNMHTHVSDICKDCKCWSHQLISNEQSTLKFQYGNENSGIEENRVHLLEQVWVDQSRFESGSESHLVLLRCTPIGAK